MDKYEFKIKVEQIKKLINKNDFETAMKIADTIDWRRVRNTNLLSMVAMVYEKNEDYQSAKEILFQAFERAPVSKRLLYKLAELAIKEGNMEEAEAYYKEFGDLASEDPRQQQLRYMILKAKGAPARQLIHSLESYTSVELDEKWLYELAELYSLAGMSERCVETCDRIMLMFGLGKYVEKAMDLKVQYAPLSEYQLDLVENRDKYEAKLRAVEQEYGAEKRKNQEYQPEEEYDEEVPVPEQDSSMDHNEMPEENYMQDNNLAARMQEAAAQESLAMEMSKINYEEPVIDEMPKIENTRVLEDIRRVGSPSTIPLTHNDQEPLEPSSEPTIEEDEPDYYEEGDYSQSEAPYEDSYNVLEPQPEAPYDLSADEGEEPGWDQDASGFYEEEELEFEDLDQEEELPVQNHLMIEARTSEKGLKMAVEALKQIHRENGVKNPVAKITGSKLSKRGVLASAEKLAGKDLVVEEAGDLTPEALAELNRLMNRDTSGMIVVLIDTPQQMEILHREHHELAGKFEYIGIGEEPPVYQETSKEVYEEEPEYGYDDTNDSWQGDESYKEEYEDQDFYEENYESQPSIREEAPDFEGEEMGIDEFAQYACHYANEIDCSITGKSMLALYERIEIMEEDGVALTSANAENLIEEAADRAEKPSFGKRIKGLFSTKYDKDGLLVLKEEHFIY